MPVSSPPKVMTLSTTARTAKVVIAHLGSD